VVHGAEFLLNAGSIQQGGCLGPRRAHSHTALCRLAFRHLCSAFGRESTEIAPAKRLRPGAGDARLGIHCLRAMHERNVDIITLRVRRPRPQHASQGATPPPLEPIAAAPPKECCPTQRIKPKPQARPAAQRRSKFPYPPGQAHAPHAPLVRLP
jgi:hypothetical protein